MNLFIELLRETVGLREGGAVGLIADYPPCACTDAYIPPATAACSQAQNSGVNPVHTPLNKYRRISLRLLRNGN
jgi:hypothetical protein